MPVTPLTPIIFAVTALLPRVARGAMIEVTAQTLAGEVVFNGNLDTDVETWGTLRDRIRGRAGHEVQLTDMHAARVIEADEEDGVLLSSAAPAEGPWVVLVTREDYDMADLERKLARAEASYNNAYNASGLGPNYEFMVTPIISGRNAPTGEMDELLSTPIITVPAAIGSVTGGIVGLAAGGPPGAIMGSATGGCLAGTAAGVIGKGACVGYNAYKSYKATKPERQRVRQLRQELKVAKQAQQAAQAAEDQA